MDRVEQGPDRVRAMQALARAARVTRVGSRNSNASRDHRVADLPPASPSPMTWDSKIGSHLFGKERLHSDNDSAPGTLQPAGIPIRTDSPHGGTRIETDRLILRHLRVEDFPDYLAIASDPDTFRYAQRGPMSSDEAWTRLLRSIGHWWLMGYGLFAIEEKGTGRFVGEVGLGDFRRDLGPDFDGVPEAAWTIARWAQGHGYATEAAAAAHAWMEVRVNATRTVCIIHPSNESSLRVAEKLGYVPFSERSYRGYSVLMLERGWPMTVSRRKPARTDETRRAQNGRRLSLGPLVALMELCGASRRRLADS